MQEPREEGDGEESQATASPWKPNEEYLKILTGMGISRVAAEKVTFACIFKKINFKYFI